MKKLLITIDTECDADIHWVKKEPLEFTSVVEGIPTILRPIWDKYGINPIYFVSYEVLCDNKCCKVLRDEISKGAIIGAHLHPEYINSEGSNHDEVYPFPCSYYSENEERVYINKLTQCIQEKLGINPVWYRAARFGADINTIHILEELGYKYDSSVTPYIDWTSKGGPDHSKGRIGHYYIKQDNMYDNGTTEDMRGIIEYPITIIGKRFGILGRGLPNNWLLYKWFRPTHMLLTELKSIIRYAQKEDTELVMMFHSMELMVNKSPYVRNRLMQSYYIFRLKKAIEYAKGIGFTTV